MKPLPHSDIDDIVKRCSRCWPELAHLLITGCTGFIGRWMTESFAHAAYAVDTCLAALAISRRVVPQESNRVHYEPCDCRDLTLLNRLWHENYNPPRMIMHLAGEPANHGNEDEIWASVVDGTEGVLKFAAQHKPIRMVMASSGAAADQTDNSFYARAKRHAEDAWLSAGGIVARIYCVYGPGSPEHYAMSQWISHGVNGGPVRMTGNWRDQRSYLYIADLCVMLWHLLAKGEPGRIYDCGGVQNYSMETNAWTVAQALRCEMQGGMHWQHVYLPDRERLDATIALGSRPAVMLADGVLRTAEWMKG